MIRRVVLVPVLAALCTCSAPLRTTLVVGSVELRRVDRDRLRSAMEVIPGDWVLRTPGLQVVLAGDSPMIRSARPGSILALTDRAVPGVAPLRNVDFFLSLGDRELQATGTRLEAVLVDATPTLRLTARYQHQGDRLTLTRDYAMEPGRRALHLRTRIQNDGGHPIAGVRYGARIAWADEAPFAPSLGVHTKFHEGGAPWVGAAERGLTVGWTRANALDLDLRFTSDVHEHTLTLGATEVVHAATNLRPAAFVEDHELLFNLPGTLGDLQRAVMLWRGTPVTDLPVVVHGAARNPATVTITTPDGHAVLISQPTADRVVLPLTPGHYVAWVTAPGSATGDPVSFEVHEGASGAVPIEVGLPPGASMRVTAVNEDDDRNPALPVRITVRGIPPTADPTLGPVHHAAGAGVVVVAASGSADFPVAPGTYRVTVSHGPEWTLATRDVTVTETLRGEIDVGLSHAVPMEGWVACDLHVHANPSFDSHVSLVDRVASLVAEGIGFATPTEHNVVGDYTEGVALLPENVTAPLQWVPAVEITTDRNAQPWGHFNVYPYAPRAGAPEGGPPPFVGVGPREIFAAARVRSPDGIIQVNHPRMQPNIGYFNVTGLDVRTGRAVSPAYDPNYDAIEVFNGFYLGQIGEVERVLHDWTSLMSRGRHYLGTGSSDSHTIAYQWAGYPRTMVHLNPGESAADHPAVLRALRQGRAFVTSGPMLLLTVNGQEPGAPVTLRGSSTVQAHVMVMAPPWMHVDTVELLRNGEVAERLAVPMGTGRLRFDATVPLTVGAGDFVLATARGPAGDLEVVLPHSNGVPYAFTNPVWMEAAR
jgi:hypothetical protein